MIVLAGLWSSAGAEELSFLDDDQWPRITGSGNRVFMVYRPQIDDWDGSVLSAHSTVSVQKGAADKTAYGEAWFTARTTVDGSSGSVQFGPLEISRVTFPSEPENQRSYLDALRSPGNLRMESMPKARLESEIAILKERRKSEAEPLAAEPPKIIFSFDPALLITVDGAPVFTPVGDTGISRVVNTRALMLKDWTGRLWLHVWDGYMESPALKGPWKTATYVPPEVKKAEALARAEKKVDLLEGDNDNKPSLGHGRPPEIFAATTPAELIVTDGPPNFEAVAGTRLLYVSNTSANIFKDPAGQKIYILISGRWFRASSLKGSWEYVPGKDLPGDLARIPDSHPRAGARASVPGTPESEEARIANSIPSTARVDRRTVRFAPEIDGEPELRRVKGTSLLYVFNCSVPLIRADERSWYAVSDGVWYTASGIRGPWAVAEYVPSAIYSIPPHSPLHHVTYVRIYDATPEFVYVGYTPGYYGTFVSRDGTVVYGTGYHYPAYVSRRAWYGWGVTYGWGSALCRTPRDGWSYYFGIGWGLNPWYRPVAPHWGPYHHGWPRYHHYHPQWGFGASVDIYDNCDPWFADTVPSVPPPAPYYEPVPPPHGAYYGTERRPDGFGDNRWNAPMRSRVYDRRHGRRDGHDQWHDENDRYYPKAHQFFHGW